jgi:hypothetical protein
MAKQYPGIVVRHGRACAGKNDGRCNCDPTFEAWVWISGRKEDREAFRLADRGEALARRRHPGCS